MIVTHSTRRSAAEVMAKATANFNVVLRTVDAPQSRLTFIANPQTRHESMHADYARLGPIGFSHGFQQYTRTDSLKISFEAYAHGLMPLLDSSQGASARADEIERMRTTLLSWLVPEVQGGGPALLVLGWGRQAPVIGRIDSVDITSDLWTPEGRLWAFHAQIQFTAQGGNRFVPADEVRRGSVPGSVR